MTFLNPLVLFGLAAAALPVILHLLHRRRLRVVEFSTLRFLKEIQHSSLRRVKLRQLLLLLLRTSLIVALVLAFARPVLRADLAGSAGPRAASAIVILIDDSPSMSVRSPRGALFDQAKEMAARIIGTAAASDRVAIIPLSLSRTDSAAPLFQAPGSARTRAETAAQSEISAPVASGLAAAASLLGTAQEANREIYLVTDGQATQFREHPSDSLPVPPAGARMFIVHTPSGTTANAGVVGIRSLTRIRAVGRPAILAVTLRNYGDAPIASLPVSIYLDGVRVAQQAAAIPPRSTASVTLPVIPRRTGILTGAAKLDEDALDLDNSRPFILTVPAETRVTLAGPAGPGTRFARLALTLGGDSLVSGRIRLREVPESQLPSADLGGTDVLLLAGIDLLTPAQGSTITSFLRRGGSMILFPGAAFDAASYRRNLWEPLSLPGWNPPAAPPATAGNAATPAQIASFARIDYDHPLFAGLFTDDRRARNEGNVESPSITRTAGQRPDPRGHPIITLTNGETFLAEYRAGGGTLFVFDVEAGISWSDFPLKGIFAPILHRSAAVLSSSAEDDSAVAAGSPLTFRVRREFRAAGSSLLLRSPGNIDERVAPAAGRSGSDAVASSITVPTIATGTYRLFAIRPGDSALVAARVAVMPESEGDLRELDQRELSTIAPVIEPAEELEVRIREARVGTELWLPFLLLAALLAVAEMWVAREQKEGESSR